MCGYSTTEQEKVNMINVKHFGDTWAQGADQLRHLIATRNNYDGNSVWAAYDLLMQTSAKNKILFVISDGMPNPEDPRILKRTIQEIAKTVRVIAFGLDYDRIKEYYPECVSCAPDELAGNMITVMRRVLFQKVTGKRAVK